MAVLVAVPTLISSKIDNGTPSEQRETVNSPPANCLFLQTHSSKKIDA